MGWVGTEDTEDTEDRDINFISGAQEQQQRAGPGTNHVLTVGAQFNSKQCWRVLGRISSIPAPWQP